MQQILHSVLNLKWIFIFTALSGCSKKDNCTFTCLIVFLYVRCSRWTQCYLNVSLKLYWWPEYQEDFIFHGTFAALSTRLITDKGIQGWLCTSHGNLKILLLLWLTKKIKITAEVYRIEMLSVKSFLNIKNCNAI